jgi:hypothetical protein
MPAEAAGALRLIVETLEKARQDSRVQTAVKRYLETQSLTSPQSPRRRAQQNKHTLKAELQIKSDLEQERRVAAAAELEAKVQAATVAEEACIAEAAAAAAHERQAQASNMNSPRVFGAQKQREIQAKRDAELMSAALTQTRDSTFAVRCQLGEAKAALAAAESSYAARARNPGSGGNDTTAESATELEAAKHSVAALINKERSAGMDLIKAENKCLMAEASAAAATRVRKEMEAQIATSGRDAAKQRSARAKEREAERRRREKTRSAAFKAWRRREEEALADELRLQTERGEEKWAAKEAEMKAQLEHELEHLESAAGAGGDKALQKKALQRQHSERHKTADEAHRTCPGHI